MKITIATLVAVVALAAAPPAPGQNVPGAGRRARRPPSPERAALLRLQTMTARFAPVPITADLSALPASERQALARIVAAARHMDAIFLRQAWAGNPSLLLDLLRDESPLGRARLRYFLINKGPWSELDKDEPFLAGIGPRPPSANFYPHGATKEEVEAWMNGLPRRGAGAGQGLLHHHPPRSRRAGSSPSPTASSTRASWRRPRRCCARPPPSPRSRR